MAHPAANLVVASCGTDPFQETDQEREVLHDLGAGEDECAEGGFDLFEELDTEDTGGGNAPAHEHPVVVVVVLYLFRHVNIILWTTERGIREGGSEHIHVFGVVLGAVTSSR